MTARVVSEPALVREVLRRPDDFRPDNALVSVTPLAPTTLRRLVRAGFALPPVLASAHGSRHREVRRAVTAFFTPSRVAALRPSVERSATTLAAQVAGRLLAGEQVDLVPSIAEPVPPEALSTLLGCELPDSTTLHRWSRDSLELFWGWPDEARQAELAESAVELYGWLRARAAADPAGGTDFFTAMRAAGLSVVEVCSLTYFLIIAGQETTTQLISTCLLRGLSGPRRELLAGGGEDAAREHVRRVLATESSVPTWRRVVPHETWLGEDRIPAGAEIVLELTGHHGPDPSPSAYGLAFGHGVHRCLGAGLAELQATIVTATVLRELPPGARVVGDVPWRRLLSFQSPTRVVVGV